MKMNLGTILLLPLSIIYGIITAIRNYLYDRGYKPSRRFNAMVVSIGNLTVGGTGKTPAIEYLTRILKDKHKMAILSRGYGRKTKKLLFAGKEDNAWRLGDEPYQLHRKFGSDVRVVVGGNRVAAILALMKRYKDTSVVLLDDAYQHRSVSPQLNILLTDFSRPFYRDYLLPAGRLREARKGAARADGIVVTKCPAQLTREEKATIKDCITHYAGKKNIFFSHIDYGEPKPFWGATPIGDQQQVVLLSGIARPAPFEKHANRYFHVLKHFIYADHYSYEPDSIRNIKRYIEKTGEGIALLTTEKDMVKLLNPIFEPILSQFNCYYIPIEMAFEDSESRFEKWILRHVRNSGFTICL